MHSPVRGTVALSFTAFLLASDGLGRAADPRALRAPAKIGESYHLWVHTPDEDINAGAALAVRALWEGAAPKAGRVVPTVCGTGSSYPNWIHPFDNYWINRVSSYFCPRESTEWPIRLFAAYQSPSGEILGGVYDIPESDWSDAWVKAGGPKGWQGYVARPLAAHTAALAAEPAKIQYGIYVREHLFVLQTYDQWQARGNLPFLIEMYGPCRRALKHLEARRDLDGNGLVESAAVLSDLVVGGDQDVHSTERAEDQVMLYGALGAFAAMAGRLGSADDANWARAWAGRIREGLNTSMWRAEGRYIFGLDRASKQPRLDYVTTTFANGYAILFGLATDARADAILDFMARQQFVVPGPYHIPPVRAEDAPQNPPGVYCNGGCGWGRGIMPSVTLACFEHGRVQQAVDYLKRQAAAARKAGSFHEYWTWEKYAGETRPGGAPWYGETSAGYLDALVHGLFGLSTPEPGFRRARLEPRFPRDWPAARLELRLPSEVDLDFVYESAADSVTVTLGASRPLPVEISLVWFAEDPVKVEGEHLVQSRVERVGANTRVVATLEAPGRVRLRR